MKKTPLISALILATISGGLMAQTLVTVNGTKIDSKTIDDQVKILQSQNKQIPDNQALRQSLLQREVDLTLVTQEAKKLKLDQNADYKKVLADALADAKKQGEDKKPFFKQKWAAYESDLLNQAYIIDVLKNNPVTDKDVHSAYNDFSKFYAGSQEVQLGEIITHNETDAQKALADLKAKKSFKSVASQYTINPDAKKMGGIPTNYMNLKDLEQTAPEIYNVVKDLKKGSYTTQPLRDNNGLYGIFYLNDKRAAQLPTFEQIKEDLTKTLQISRVNHALEALYQKADIKPAQ